ncbi:MAG: phage tail sheath family protein [Chlorobiaceae bacterium]|nr:phage tail sheath family protein [Chlorobiaceae bacterium]
MLNQCGDLQDRFSILDVLEGDLAEDVTNKPLSGFRDTIGINNLSYGAAYYPWIVTSYGYDLSFRQLQLFDKEEPDTEIDSFDSLSGNDTDKKLVTSVTEAIADTDALLAIGDASLKVDELRSKGSGLLKEQLSKYHEAIAVAADPASSMTSWLNLLGGVAVAFGNAESKAAGAEFVKVIKSIKDDDKLLEALAFLVAVEKNPKTVANTESRDAVKVKELYMPLDTGWFGTDKFEAVVADGSNFEKSTKGCHEIIKTLSPSVITILNAWQRLLDALLHFEKLAESAVFSAHPFFLGVHEKIIARMRTVPPSGTIAGICASVDRTRGVWKSPANVSLNAVIGPAVRMDNREQEEMNVHTTGKSINAIRAFTGRGTLVWGSRTLAGNDQEWRYVPVRRFFIMVEESTKKATEPFVFEPNDANTWVKVRTMIENFLTLQWRAGALQGSKPDEAFYVRVGLNETMTAQDVLEGFMIVEIGLAAVRPAEFIVLRFSHQMQASGG